MEYMGQYCQGMDTLLNLHTEVMEREHNVNCKLWKIVNMKVCIIFSPKFQMNRPGYRYGLLQIGKLYVLFITYLFNKIYKALLKHISHIRQKTTVLIFQKRNIKDIAA